MRSCENCDHKIVIYKEYAKTYLCDNTQCLRGLNRKAITGCGFWKNLKLERKLKLDKINDKIYKTK